jgi:hypothetical protein
MVETIAFLIFMFIRVALLPLVVAHLMGKVMGIRRWPLFLVFLVFQYFHLYPPAHPIDLTPDNLPVTFAVIVGIGAFVMWIARPVKGSRREMFDSDWAGTVSGRHPDDPMIRAAPKAVLSEEDRAIEMVREFRRLGFSDEGDSGDVGRPGKQSAPIRPPS